MELLTMKWSCDQCKASGGGNPSKCPYCGRDL